jgi:hypothetical protein
MNKLIVYFLVFVFLCANTSLGQLVKLPNLVEHYKAHKNELSSNSISFFDYVKLHYAKNVDNNQDHQNLPFKTLDNSISVLFVFPLMTFQIPIVNSIIAIKKKFFYNKSFTSNLIISIWLPPKIF